MRAAALAVVAVVLTGCATAQSRGERALLRGDFPAALAEFQTALVEHPERAGALQALGLAHYKTGALADAAATFEQVLGQAPQSGSCASGRWSRIRASAPRWTARSRSCGRSR